MQDHGAVPCPDDPPDRPKYRTSRRIRDRRGTPIKPEQRQCARPTTKQISRLFSPAERHTLTEDGHTVQIFDVQRTDRQREALAPLGVSGHAFRSPRWAGRSRQMVSLTCGM